MNLVTQEDLLQFKRELLADIELLFTKHYQPVSVGEREGLKTKHVRKVLGCCYNTLQSLRIAGKLRWKKVGGTVYYHPDDVRKLIHDGFH
jgi:hypothetical protein